MCLLLSFFQENVHIQKSYPATEGLENVNVPYGASARGDWCAAKLIHRINKHVGMGTRGIMLPMRHKKHHDLVGGFKHEFYFP